MVGPEESGRQREGPTHRGRVVETDPNNYRVRAQDERRLRCRGERVTLCSGPWEVRRESIRGQGHEEWRDLQISLILSSP